MRVRWSDRAEADLEDIVLHIAQDSVEAALRVQTRLIAAASGLSHFPERGRHGLVTGTREIVVAHTSCIAVYLVERDTVWIVRIRHGAQDWPPDGGSA